MTKARKLNQVFQSRVGLSAHITKFDNFSFRNMFSTTTEEWLKSVQFLSTYTMLSIKKIN